MNACIFPLSHIPTLDRGYKIRWPTTGKDVDSQENEQGREKKEVSAQIP